MKPLRMPQSRGIYYCIIAMTKYSNLIFAIVLREEGQVDEKNKNGNDAFHPTELGKMHVKVSKRGPCVVNLL